MYRQIGDKIVEEQDRGEIQDSLDKKKGQKGGHFWAGVLTGA